MTKTLKDDFPLSDEQLAIETAATDTKDNLLVSALAGSAKTYTLKVVANALPKVPILCLAFNKKIAMEMNEEMPDNCTAKTLNSYGLSVWRNHVQGKLVVDTGKNYRILKELIEMLSGEDKSEAYETMGMIMKEMSRAKNAGHIPESLLDIQKPKPLISDEEMFLEMEEEPTDLTRYLILEALRTSTNEALNGRVDFDDMILFPTVYRCSFPRNSLVLIDEAQDLSPLNHVLLGKIVCNRIIAVGDKHQAIYGFRGASNNSMKELRKQFNMTELHLTTTFRCPEEIVEHVRWHTPDMKSWDQTPPGTITKHASWSVHDIPDGAAVICRNNAPLFNMAIQLLKNGRYPDLWGNDLSKGMIKLLKKLGPESMSKSSAYNAIADWEDKALRKARNKQLVLDKAACLRVFVNEATTLGGAIEYAHKVFNSEGPIRLMTGHKCKGHQFDHVYFLDQHLLGDKGQENNLRYVICTRAMRSLHYIMYEGCEELPENTL